MKQIPELKGDKIIFRTVLQGGCPSTPQWMCDMVEKLLKEKGRELVDYGGDFDTTWFLVNKPFDKE